MKLSENFTLDELTKSQEAIRLGNDYIGQEHLFLGILRDGEGIATDIYQLGYKPVERAFYYKKGSFKNFIKSLFL